MSAATQNAGFRRDIQGLRAVAVLLVVANHAALPGVDGGYIGVDIFFVISGYLITGQLFKDLTTTGRIHFRDFYTKRARRILPASLLVASLTAVACVLFVAPVRLTAVLQHAIATVLYVPNIVFAAQGTDYLAETVPSPFQHYWSLGVEEQFYVFWPLIMLLAFWLLRRSTAGLAIALGVIAAASLVFGVIETDVSQPVAFFILPTRAWELAAGGLLALAPLERIPRAIRAAASWAGLAVIGVFAVTFDADTAFPGLAALLPVGGAALVILGADERYGARLLLGLRPFQFVGLISYSLYLVHWPLQVLPQEAIQWTAPLPIWLSATLAIAAIPLAWLLYRFVESRFRVSRKHPAMPRQTLIRIGGATAAVALLVGTTILWSSVRSLTTDRMVDVASVQADPAGTDVVPANLSPDLRTASTTDYGELSTLGCQQTTTEPEVLACDFGDLTSGDTIALFGDSHAGRWFSAVEKVAEQRGLHLTTYVKSSCRSIEVDENYDAPDESSCGSWRADVVKRLTADPPDLILLANVYPESTTIPAADNQQRWVTAIEHSIARLPRASRAVMLAETPQLPVDPLYCLSAHPDAAASCSTARDQAFNEPVLAAQREAADRGIAPLIDLGDYFCDADACPTIIGSTLVYSDQHHVTDEFSATLVDPLAKALIPLLS